VVFFSLPQPLVGLLLCNIDWMAPRSTLYFNPGQRDLNSGEAFRD
jgi:hypothetical protein